MAQKIIDNVRISLRADTLDNWNKKGTLTEGEVGIITNGDTLYGIAVGPDGDSEIAAKELISKKNIVYAGIGAGLTAATSDVAGIIRPSKEYFSMNGNQLLISENYIHYSVGDDNLLFNDRIPTGTQNYLKLVTKNDTHLLVQGSIIADDLNVENLIAKVGEIETLKTTTTYTITETTRVFPLNKTIESIDENGNPVVNEAQTLVDGEYSGLQFYNYDESNRIGEFGITTDGKLYYTNDNTQTIRNQILTINPSATGFLKFTGGDSVEAGPIYNSDIQGLPTLTFNSLDTKIYNPVVNQNCIIDIPYQYCTTIVANGVSYTLGEDNQTITLGTSLWTDEYKEKLDNTLSSIKVNNIEITNTNNEISLASTDNSIDIAVNENIIDLAHYEVNPVDAQIEDAEIAINNDNQSFLIPYVKEHDRYGHITKYNYARISFENLINRITILENKIKELESKGN